MKIKSVQIHNFRSIKDGTLNIDDYSLLIGENNVGKTNFITALRIFYEDSIKYSEEVDFPKFPTDDNESWIEIEYKTTEEEQNQLKEEYRSKDDILKLRKYFKSDDNNRIKANQSNIFAYENGNLSSNLFYGAKNISQAKLGSVIYIPDISKTDDTLKLTGPSPFRNIINFVMKKAIKNSESYRQLAVSFDEFNREFKDEYSKDGFSINTLVDDINESIYSWQIKFGLTINPVQPEDIVKSLLSHFIQDKNLNGQKISINSCGQGLQRHLIYTLLMLSAKYVDKTPKNKKDFSPDFTLILFEEPEAFLHPSQQENLNISLKSLAQSEDEQVLITTHSPTFICRNIEDLKCLCRLQKVDGVSSIYQLTEECIEKIKDNNLSIFKKFTDVLNCPTTESSLKAAIKSKRLFIEESDLERKLEQESIKYMLWLDSERSSMFFAKNVIICEGATEKVFLDYLFNSEWTDLRDNCIYVLDAMGKFNIHRYMNLFANLGISHSVIIDSDKDAGIQGIFNEFINDNKNSFTKNIFAFDVDLEDFLKIEKPERRDLKPLNIMYNYKIGKIIECNIVKLREIIIRSL